MASVRSTQVYISGRITDCGPENLGGDGSIGFFQRELDKRGYQVFSQEIALSLGGSKAQSSCEAAIAACQILVVLVTQDLGKTSRNMKELQQVLRDGKVVIPVWHSGSEYPPPGTADLLKGPKLPATSKPFVESCSEETIEELVMRLQMKGCYPTKSASVQSKEESLLVLELSQRLANTPILMSRESPAVDSLRSGSGLFNPTFYNLGGSGNSSSKVMLRKDSSTPSSSGGGLHREESADFGGGSFTDHGSRSQQLPTISVPSCVAPALKEGEWHVFLSHYQANAGNTVFSLKLILEAACPGLKCWYDNDQDPTEAGMRNGVGNSRYYLLYLTKEAMTRPALQYEARTALSIGKPIVMVKETDPRFGGAVNFDEYIQETPEDLKPLFGKATAIPWFRDKEFRDVSTKKILRALGIAAAD